MPLRDHALLGGALAAIGAAVVGVILNLGVWFALHVIFARTVVWEGVGLAVPLPDPASVDWAALVLTIAAVIAALRFRVGMGWLLACWGLAGLGWTLLT